MKMRGTRSGCAGLVFVTILGVGTLLFENYSNEPRGEVSTRNAAFAIDRVLDGDSLFLRDESGRSIEVRIHAIDAPERDQPASSVSRNHLRGLLEGGVITIIERDRDRYGRVVAKLLVDGQDVGLEQIRAGMAWHYRRYASAQPAAERVAYETAEASARRSRTGLWADDSPINPEALRREQRERENARD